MSSNAAAVAVNASGLATAVRNGTATITATAGGRSAGAQVTVAQAIASVTVSPATATLTAAGRRVQFAAQATDANGRPVTGKVITWAGGPPDVITVSPTGQATAAGSGTAQITATVEGQTGSAMLTVAIPGRAAPAPVAPAPAAPPAELPAVNATLVLKNVSFRPNSAQLPPEAHADLDAVAQGIQAIPTARWEIGGYTSSMGNPARNQALSRRRALAVRAYLIQQGVPASRLVAVGYGVQNPVASNTTVAGRRQNMRVEIKRLR
jgi:OOP family OmpA-OmpF porin